MQPDVRSGERARRALAALRLRVAGTAILGLVVVVWWLLRLTGIWQDR